MGSQTFQIGSEHALASDCEIMSVYLIQYAKSGRAKCKAGKSCSEMIPDGELRVGTQVEVPDRGMQTSWRHWKCVTDRVLKNIIGKAGGPEGMQGFDELDNDAQELVKAAFDRGSVHAPEGEEEAPTPAKAKAKAAPKRGRKAAKETEPEEEEEEEEGGHEEEVRHVAPKRGRGIPPTKQAARKTVPQSGPPAAKGRGKAKAVAAPAAPKAKRGRPKKAVVEEPEEEDEEEEPPKAKKAKAAPKRKAAPKAAAMSKATGRGKMVAAPVEEELAQEKEEKNDEEVDEAAAGKEEEAMGKEVKDEEVPDADEEAGGEGADQEAGEMDEQEAAAAAEVADDAEDADAAGD